MELVNQSLCAAIYNPKPQKLRFDPDKMICAGDVVNGGMDACEVSY